MSLVIYKKSKESHHIYSDGRLLSGTRIVNENHEKVVSNNYFIAGCVGCSSAQTFLDALNQTFVTIDDVFYKRDEEDYFGPELEGDDEDCDEDDGVARITLPDILKFSSLSWMQQICKSTVETLDCKDFSVIIAFRRSESVYLIDCDAETKSIVVTAFNGDFYTLGSGADLASGVYAAGVTDPKKMIKIVSTLESSVNDKVFHVECKRFLICLPTKKD